MAVISQNIFVVRQPIDQSQSLLMPLMFPEYSRLITGDRIPRQFKERIDEIVKALPNSRRFQRVLAESPTIHRLVVDLPATRNQRRELLWQKNIDIPFYAVVWSHESEATIAFVPALQIEVIRDHPYNSEFEEAVRLEVQNALRRRKMVSLASLHGFSKYGEPEIMEIPIHFQPLSPKEEALAKQEKKDDSATLREIGKLMDPARRPAAFELEDPIQQLHDTLFSVHPRSALLVGPSGVGKSSLVHELIRQRFSFGIGATEFWETSGSRIVAGMSGFGQWQERCEKFVVELKNKNAVLFLGNLFELVHVGKSESQKQGIASYLRPSIERGNIKVIAECLPEQLSLLEKEDPQLLLAFQKIELKRPDQKRCIRILKSESRRETKSPHIAVKKTAIETLYHLHQRYAAYSAMPGRPVQFLRNMISDVRNSGREDVSIDSEQVISRFSELTGLPFFLLSRETPLKAEPTREWFSQRVMGQPEPVDLVVDMFASVKADLTRGGRPIASFLFIGPTGVGKTEMAKSIAEFMFSDPQKMIRFDMSEYSNPLSVERLIGGAGGKEGLMTSRVRQAPFSVLLLDEFEKAHPSFFDLLLQVLGEGRLTDARGRVTDFSTTIIVMTSNLGAETLKQQSFGFGSTERLEDHAKEHFKRAVQKFVRSELFNRIDRIVPFAPLTETTIQRVVMREMEKMKNREGLQFRPVTLKIDDAAVQHVARTGHDQRYGARPIQRYIQDHLVVPIGSQLNRYSPDTKLSIHVTSENGTISFDTQVKPPEKTNLGTVSVSDDSPPTPAESIRMIRHQRRRAQALSHCSLANRIRNEYYRLRQSHEKNERFQRKAIRKHKLGKVAGNHALEKLNKELWQKESELEQYRKILDEIIAIENRGRSLELNALNQQYSQGEMDADELRDQALDLRTKINGALFDLFVFDSNDPEKVTILVYGRNQDLMKTMIRAYDLVASQRNYKVGFLILKKPDGKDSKPLFAMRRELSAAEKLDADQPDRDGNATVDSPSHSVAAHQDVSVSNTDKNETSSGKTADPLIVAECFESSRESLLSESVSGLVALVIQVRGSAAFPLFAAEKGIHHFRSKQNESVFVEVIGHSLKDHRLPAEAGTPSILDRDEKSRTYDLEKKTLSDQTVGTQVYSQLEQGIADSIETFLQKHLDQIIESWN